MQLHGRSEHRSAVYHWRLRFDHAGSAQRLSVIRGLQSQSCSIRSFHVFPARVQRGCVRDLPVPWALEEARLPYRSPCGFTVKTVQMDARVGGGYRMAFTNFGTRSSHSFRGRYVERTLAERIRYADQFDDPNSPGEMRVSIDFRDHASSALGDSPQRFGLPRQIPSGSLDAIIFLRSSLRPSAMNVPSPTA